MISYVVRRFKNGYISMFCNLIRFWKSFKNTRRNPVFTKWYTAMFVEVAQWHFTPVIVTWHSLLPVTKFLFIRQSKLSHEWPLNAKFKIQIWTFFPFECGNRNRVSYSHSVAWIQILWSNKSRIVRRSLWGCEKNNINHHFNRQN